LAHPVSILLVGGVGIWFVLTYLRREYLAQWYAQRSVRWGALLGVVLVAALGLRFIPQLHGWVTLHDKNPGSGQFLLRPLAQGLKQIVYVTNFAESLTLPLVLAAMMGIYLLWRQRDRSLALLLIGLSLVPLVFLALVSMRSPVSTYYLLPTVSVFFIGAGVFLDRLCELDWGPRPRWLLPAMMAAVIIAAGAPTLISDYRDGRRYNFRGAARWLEPRLSPEDVVFSDQHMVLAHYLSGTDVKRLRQNTAPLTESLRMLRRPGSQGTLWIVAPAASHAFRTNLKYGGLIDWVYGHCQLSQTMGVGRVDFRQQYLQIYRCPPAVASDTGADQGDRDRTSR
jgi:hypothetical protein